MTRYIIIWIVLCLLGCSHQSCQEQQRDDDIHIIPIPKKIDKRKGFFLINASTNIYSNQLVGSILIDSIINRLNIPLIKSKKNIPENSIFLEYKNDLLAEEYIIDISSECAKISASTNTGMYYGIQSFFQLLPTEIDHQDKHSDSYYLPCIYIRDYPQMEYRGILIDVCRHFFSVDEIKKQIAIMGSLKLNKLHLHLTDNQGWRIEIKKYPELINTSAIAETYNGEKYGPYYYTQDDIREIISYANLHHIEVIPEIEFPGHSLSALVPFPHFSCSGGPFKSEQVFGFEENVFCVGNEDVYTFMQDVLTEIAGLFPSAYIHIGGDECSKKHWKLCPKCQSKAKELGLKEGKHSVEEQLQSYAIHRIQDFISSKLNKKMIGWHEVLEGGISKDVTIMSWRDPQIGYSAAKEGYKVIMAPMPEGFYLCDYQGGVEVEPAASGEFSSLKQLYNYIPTPEPDCKSNIIGLEACAWTEWCPDVKRLEYMMYPRVIALAENAWCNQDQKDWTGFQKRLDSMQIRLKYQGVNFHIPMPEGVATQNRVFNQDTVVIQLENSRSLPMVYTIDGTVPTIHSTLLPNRLILDHSCCLKVATVASGNLLSPVRLIDIDKQEKPIKAVQASFNGIRLKIADGLFKTDKDYDRAIFHTDTIISSLADYNKDKFDYRRPSLAVYSGFIHVSETKVYTFESNVDELWIANKRLIYNPTSSRFYAQKSQIFLEKGFHQFKLVFSNRLKEGFATCWYDIDFKYY